MKKFILSLLLVPIYFKHYAQIDWIQKGNSIVHNINSTNNIDLSSDGNTIVVGIPMYEQWGDNVGLVEVYSYQNNSWILKGQSIKGNFPGSHWGYTVSISGDGNTIAFGDPNYMLSSYNGEGVVFIYKWQGGSWIFTGGVNGTGYNHNTGQSIDLSFDGNTIVISSLNGGNSGGGVAKIYQFTGSIWMQKGSTLPDLYGWNSFGHAVCISNDGKRVAIGMPSYGNVQSGRVFLYEWGSNDWSVIGFVNGLDYNERLGLELKMSGDGNVIAASGENNTRIFEYSQVSGNPSVSLIQRGQNFVGTNAKDENVVSIDNNGSHVIIGFTQNYLTKVYSWENSNWVQYGPTFTGNGHSVAINGLGTNVAISFYDPVLIKTNVFEICRIPEGIDNIVACDSLTWINGITYYNSTNSPQFYISSAANICDSIAKLNLTIINTKNYTLETHSACDSFTWIDGNTYTTSNNSAKYTLSNIYGCDSTILLNLTIHNSNSSLESMNACESFYWNNNGQTYTQTGIYSSSLTNFHGCDSIVYLNLTITGKSTKDLFLSGCDSVSINGSTYNSTGDYFQYLTNSFGCDSLLNLHLNIPTSYSLIDNIFTCDTYTWIDGQTYVNDTSGIAFNLLSSEGCDSIIHLNLDIGLSSDKTTIINTTAIDNFIIQGQTFTESGTYYLYLLDQFGCDSMVQINVIIESSGFKELENDNLVIYPNPSSDGIFQFKIKTNYQIEKITDSQGREIQYKFIDYSTLELQNKQIGIYVISISNGKRSERFKLVIW